MPVRRQTEVTTLEQAVIFHVQRRNGTNPQLWNRLVRGKLTALGLLKPVGAGLHEWSPAYRDLVFEMASFMAGRDDPLPKLAREFLRQSHNRVLPYFSEEEVGRLLAKSQDYEWPGTAVSVAPKSATLLPAWKN